jgi:hypothetical protein
MEFFVMRFVEVNERGESKERHVDSWTMKYIAPIELYGTVLRWVSVTYGLVNATRAGRFARGTVSVCGCRVDVLDGQQKIRIELQIRRLSKWSRVTDFREKSTRKFLVRKSADFRKMLRKLAKYKSARPTQKDIMDMYYPKHCCCPSCGSDSIETTCVGYMFEDIETAKDGNRATCGCGWRGIVHDLVPSA